MKTNKINWNEEYIIDMKKYKNDYLIDLESMNDWILSSHKRIDRFKKDMLSNDNLFALAIDYSIPVIMVKYFKKQVVKWR